jgi:hypothetical protein
VPARPAPGLRALLRLRLEPRRHDHHVLRHRRGLHQGARHQPVEPHRAPRARRPLAVLRLLQARRLHVHRDHRPEARPLVERHPPEALRHVLVALRAPRRDRRDRRVQLGVRAPDRTR